MRIGIHQSNFVPWFPYFYKMAMCDVFIHLDHVQFEKNGFQNRFMYKGKWITIPVFKGNDAIDNKRLVSPFQDGTFGEQDKLTDLSRQWIRTLKNTFRIEAEPHSTNVHLKYPEDPTECLIYLVKEHKGSIYVTNPTAKDKYLEEDKMRAEGIDIEYCEVPKHLQKSTFEIIEEYGIEGAIKQLPKRRSYVTV